MSLRNILIIKAKIAEHAQRYEDMSQTIKTVVELGHDLNNDERNMLSIAYKHVTGIKRQSWRIICGIELSAELQNDPKTHLAKQYREKIELDLEQFCLEIIELIDNYLLKVAVGNESLVFYHKMKGDYYRYLCEIASVPDKHKKLLLLANTSYSTALSLSEKLKVCDPLRLGLALNFAVFLHEIKKSKSEAVLLAQAAFDQAISQADSFYEVSYKDTTNVLQLLNDNLKLWNNKVKENNAILSDHN